MALEHRSLVVGLLQVNCYLVWCSETLEGLVIDPGDEGDRIIAEIQRHGFRPVAIVNTHCHGDHIGANEAVKSVFGIPLWTPADETALLSDADLNFSSVFGPPIVSPKADRTFREGDTLEFGRCTFRVLDCRGHSPGGACLYMPGVLFSGDALFAGSVGRCDIPGASFDTLAERIRTRLYTLPDDTRVFPGHGPSTTIGNERRHNPFVQDNGP